MQDEIKNAIAAHGMWKARLKGVIDTGNLDVPVETIRVDNQCPFGKWLYGSTIPANVKASAQYSKVKALHADFHKVAAKVAETALAGRKDEARQLLEVKGEYAGISSKLTQEMMGWLNEVDK